VCLPLGLPDDLVDELGRADTDAAARLADQEVLAIGTWDLRKGRRDWPAIVDLVLARHPGTRFHFIGTSVDRDAVLAEFSADARGAIRVTARYGPGEMTELLRSGTVNALPTYIEGFGLGVLEGLAAGIPSVVYDVPGPRETVGRIDPGAMVSVGDHAAFAAALGERLSWPAARYAEIAQQGRELAEEHRWSAIADRTLEVYRERLDGLPAA
jgi:glycosyltransferase involved in cell wall biosynthesis